MIKCTKYILYILLLIHNIHITDGFIVRSSSYGNLNMLYKTTNKNEGLSKSIIVSKASKKGLKLKKTNNDNDLSNLLIHIKNINRIYFSHKTKKLLIVYNNNTRISYYIDDSIKVVLGKSIYSSLIYLCKEFISDYVHHLFASIFHY